MLAITPLFNLIPKKRFYKRKNSLKEKKNLPHQNLFILSDQTFLIVLLSLLHMPMEMLNTSTKTGFQKSLTCATLNPHRGRIHQADIFSH